MKTFFRFIVPAFALLILANSHICAQTHKVDISKLIDETQLSDDESEVFTLVWWIPEEFWKYTFESDQTMSQSEKDQIMDYFRPYTIVMVADGTIGSFGGITYTPESTLRKNIRIIDNSGAKYSPIDEEDINADTQSFLMLMQPMLANMLGPMGKNMNFFVFPAKTAGGKKIGDPYGSGTFTVKFDERDFKYRLPLGSLIPEKKCPVDGEMLNGAWQYCPWHGKVLE